MAKHHHTRHTASRLLLSLLAPLSVFPAIGQTTSAPQPEGRFLYTGDTARVAVGYANGGYFQGELSGVLSERADSAWLAEGWVLRSAGGAKLSYHQVAGDAVNKYFLAFDQNETADRKFTLGAGVEKGHWFGNAYLSRGISDRRLLSQSSASAVTQVTGTEGGRAYQDAVTRVVTTHLFERAYDYGVGVRAGHYFDETAVRVTAGLDYEWGRGNAQQSSVSVMAEKYFVGSPHSVGLQLDLLQKTGDAEVGRENTRVMLSYRYSFGAKNTQPERMFRMVAGQPPSPAVGVAQTVAPTVIPASTERRMVLTKATMTSDAFFEISSAKLTPTARAELDKIADMLKTSRRDGNVRIVGHTCDLGSQKFNIRLSMMRATSVRDYLVAAGAITADAAILEGKASSEPKFAPEPATRSKNRRVELEFVNLSEKEEIVQIPAKTIPGVAAEAPAPVVYQREVIEQEPAWLRRALRTPTLHKRTVDVYRSKEETQTESVSRTWANRTPVAQNDSYSVVSGSTTALAVLGNDSDPDAGDVLTVASVSAAGKGQVRLEGGQVVYVAPANYSGQDSFTYMARDGQGATSTATVQIQVTQANRAPVAKTDSYTVGSVFNSTLAVLANDSDADGDPLSIVAVTQPVGGNGTVKIEGPTIVFTPKNAFLTDSFTYTISDGKGGTSTATVELIDP